MAGGGWGGVVVSVVVVGLLFVGCAKKFCNFPKNWLII